MFGKVGRCASEEVIVELLKTEYLPSLPSGPQACPVNKSVTISLEYVIEITHLFRKLFDTKSYDIANECILMFNYSMYDVVHRRKS